jgi:hypothetical protein
MIISHLPMGQETAEARLQDYFFKAQSATEKKLNT